MEKENSIIQSNREIIDRVFDPSKKTEMEERYAKAIKNMELPGGIKLLNEAEKLEVIKNITNIMYDQHPNLDIVYEMAGRFGERIVPYILNSPITLDGIMVMKILNGLVTEKTAGIVLKAMRDKKIEIWSGALAAARGKKKTALGLANILMELNFLKNYQRSNHIELIKALGETGDDKISSILVDFYKKLLKDENYKKIVKENLKENGINWYDNDALEIARSLLKINGPMAKDIFDKLSKRGDARIKKAIGLINK